MTADAITAGTMTTRKHKRTVRLLSPEIGNLPSIMGCLFT